MDCYSEDPSSNKDRMKNKVEVEPILSFHSCYSGYNNIEVSVRNAITKLELSVRLEKVKSALGAYIWEIREQLFTLN